MKICMLVLNEVDPDIRVEKEALSLAKAGHHVTIIGITTITKAIIEIPGSPRTLQTVIKDDVSYIIKRIKIRFKGALKYLEYWLKVGKKFRKEKLFFDVIHYHDLNTLPLIGFLGPHANKHLYDSHELFPEMMRMKYGKMSFRVFSWLERKYIKNVDIIITPGKACVEAMQNKYPLKFIYSIPNYPEADMKHVFPNKYHKFTIVIWGNIYFKRGYEEALEAIYYLKMKDRLPEDFQLLIIGTGPCEDKLKDFVDEMNLKQLVNFSGWINRKYALELMEKCHFGICLVQKGDIYLESANPNRLFDYIFCGLPSIVSDIVGHRNLFDEEDNFITFVQSDDIEEIAFTMLDAYRTKWNDLKYKRLHVEALAAYYNRFNWKVVEKELKEVYNKLSDENELS